MEPAEEVKTPHIVHAKRSELTLEQRLEALEVGQSIDRSDRLAAMWREQESQERAVLVVVAFVLGFALALQLGALR
jgi:hypothetical protein